MTRPDPVRVGIVGLGRLGRHHATNLAGRLPTVDLVRVVDVREDVAREVGEELGVPWSTDVATLLDDETVEAIVIATSTATHAELVTRAAAAAKHVFCEKPLSFDHATSERAVTAARDAGVILQVGFHRRFDPDWIVAVERIRAGEVGDVHLLRTSLRDKLPPSIDYVRTSGGFFVDVTIHDLDTARWMVGEIDEISAQGAAVADPRIAEVGDIDTAVVTLRFANGAIGVIDNSRTAGYGYECSTEVVGSAATVRIGGHQRTNVKWLTPGRACVDWVDDFVQRYPDAYRDELTGFAAAVRGEAPIRVRGEDDLAALVLAAAAARSLAERRPVRLAHALADDGTVRYSLLDEA
jgi:inositol 2-dehydrogenase